MSFSGQTALYFLLNPAEVFNRMGFLFQEFYIGGKILQWAKLPIMWRSGVHMHHPNYQELMVIMVQK